MTFLCEDYRLTEGKITKTIMTAVALASFFGNHAEAPADLSMAINGRPNTVLIPGLDCFPNSTVWTNFTNFQKIFGYFSTGKRWGILG